MHGPFHLMYMCSCVPTEISGILVSMESTLFLHVFNNSNNDDYNIGNKICVWLFYFVVLGN